jgi:hypothetical protein
MATVTVQNTKSVTLVLSEAAARALLAVVDDLGDSTTTARLSNKAVYDVIDGLSAALA